MNFKLASKLDKMPANEDAIILHEQADQGLTIIERIEKYTDVDYAVVLFMLLKMALNRIGNYI